MEKIIDYLKTLSDLETTVYQQTKACETAHKNLVYEKPSPKTIDINPPINKADSVEVPKKATIDGLFFFYVSLIIAPILILFGGIYSASTILIIIGVASGILFIPSFFKVIKDLYIDKIIDYKKNYNSAISLKEKYLNEYRIELSKYQKEFQKKQIRNDALYKRTINIYNRNYGYLQENVNIMDKNLLESKNILQQAYDLNIIFPKYRNLVAISTIYEYFASGRVTELEGPNGAYNLYESELRQNIIINNLETISSDLETIKNNQYVLYTELANTNELLTGIANGVQGVLHNTDEIAGNTLLTAYNTRIAAENTAVLTAVEAFK